MTANQIQVTRSDSVKTSTFNPANDCPQNKQQL